MYLAKIDGDGIPGLLRESLTDEILVGVLKTLSKHADKMDADRIFALLEGFSNAKRFTTAAMFMEDSDKAHVDTIFAKISHAVEASRGKDQIDAVRKAYA